MPTVPNDADAIRQKMATIRRELHDDVREVVATASAATDWKSYLTAYPWASLGAAFAVGYFVVPKRRRSVSGMAAAEVTKLREAVEDVKETAAARVEGTQTPAVRRAEKKGLIAAAFGMIVPLALRAGQNYAMKYLEQWIAQQQALAMQAGPASSPWTAVPKGPAGAAHQERPGPGRRPPGPAGPL